MSHVTIAEEVPVPAADRVTRPATGIPVTVVLHYVRPFRDTLQLDATAVAWTSDAVEITWPLTDGTTARLWVTPSAVTRR